MGRCMRGSAVLLALGLSMALPGRAWTPYLDPAFSLVVVRALEPLAPLGWQSMLLVPRGTSFDVFGVVVREAADE